MTWKNEKKSKALLVVFGIYLALLAWCILFKFALRPEEIPHLRGINLIPYAASVVVNGKVQISEIIENMLVFLPFGLCISAIYPDSEIQNRILLASGLSLFFEVTQYIFLGQCLVRSDDHKGFLGEGGDFHGEVVDVPFHKPDGKQAVFHMAHDIRRIPRLTFDFDLMVPHLEIVQHLRQHEVGQRSGCADANLARQFVTRHQREHILELVIQRGQPFFEQPPLVIEPDAPAHAIEQRNPQFSFEITERAGNRRLRYE